MKNEQLCWSCKRAIPNHGCEWADKFKPVKGWTATLTKVKQGRYNYEDSYAIEKCPKYINDHDSREAI